MSCKDCKRLRRQLDAAQQSFTHFAKPYYAKYAALSFSEVQKFESLSEPYARDVRSAKRALSTHEGKCAS